MSRQATVLIADEIYYNLHGKAILQGIYNADLAIPGEQITAPQLIFFFIIEADLSNPFQSLVVEITLPGGEPIRQSVFVPPPQFVTAQAHTQPGRTRWHLRHPVLIPTPVLRPGRIEVKIIHESGEIEVGAPWIVGPPNAVPSKPS
jgi:hypothetical protein